MMDGWKLDRAIELWEPVIQQAAGMSIFAVPAIVGISVGLLASAIAAKSMRKGLRDNERLLIERILRDVRYEIAKEKEINLARTALETADDLSEDHAELANQLDDRFLSRGSRREDQEDKSLQKLVSAMRRAKNRDLETR